MLEIYNIGQTVILTGSGVTGMIKGALIESDSIVQYKIGYFNGATYSEIWLREFEFCFSYGTNPDKTQIGFRPC